MRALVIAAHGSHYFAGTALPAWDCVDAIRQTGTFDEVTPTFWKEQPSFGEVLEGLHADEITIVPLFMSEGFFSQKVLPAELQPRRGQSITITPAIGTTAYFTNLVERRIQHALRQTNSSPADAAVVIVGHGTPKHSKSNATTEHQAQLLAKTGQFGDVKTAYLDEAPYIGGIFSATTCPTLVIVPFFIAEGLHTQQDIPEALGLQPPLYAPKQIHTRQVIYTPPVGLANDLYQVVLQLAGADPDVPRKQSTWGAFPKPQIDLNRLTTWGEISLQHPEYLCHIADTEKRYSDLQQLQIAAEIRATLRFVGDTYRPLASMRNLARGWAIPTHNAQQRTAALASIYPATLQKPTTSRSPQVVGARQQGKYRAVAHISEEKTQEVVDTLCQQCIKHPVWHDGSDALPSCAEPCSMWLEAAIQ